MRAQLGGAAIIYYRYSHYRLVRYRRWPRAAAIFLLLATRADDTAAGHYRAAAPSPSFGIHDGHAAGLPPLHADAGQPLTPSYFYGQRMARRLAAQRAADSIIGDYFTFTGRSSCHTDSHASGSELVARMPTMPSAASTASTEDHSSPISLRRAAFRLGMIRLRQQQAAEYRATGAGHGT